MDIEEMVVERSKKCNVFGNPLRSHIAAFISAKGETTWSELKDSWEELRGPINPNTLSFHIGVLMDEGFVEKISVEGQPRYKIPKGALQEIERLVGRDLIQKMKEAYP